MFIPFEGDHLISLISIRHLRRLQRLKTIQEHGFKQELFTNFLGASGGPKWLPL